MITEQTFTAAKSTTLSSKSKALKTGEKRFESQRSTEQRKMPLLKRGDEPIKKKKDNIFD